MNDIDEFLEVAAAIFFAICGLLVLLTHLEHSLYRNTRPATTSLPATSEPAPGPSNAPTPVVTAKTADAPPHQPSTGHTV